MSTSDLARAYGKKGDKAVLCFSGGLDSTVLLFHLQHLGYEVYTVGVDYGQRHFKELHGAVKIAEVRKIEHRCLDLQAIGGQILAGSSQTDPSVPVPDGHYEEETMKATVVPNRNMILLSLATAWAVSLKAQFVAYAAHAGDHAIYPDCRKEFIDIMAAAIRGCDWHRVELITPLIGMKKWEIVKVGADLGVPFNMTYSCYKGGVKHCGVCGTCTERREAFTLAGVQDPTEYEA